ncbi:MAG: hypothetical protein JWM89_4049 [Acidimicrobiales bacterium]|nr:hypothetical protein [Acidimicrobiales bacterium]
MTSLTTRSNLQLSLDLDWPRPRSWSRLEPGVVGHQAVELVLPGFDRRDLGRLIVLAEVGDRFASGVVNLDEAIEFAVDRARSGRLCAETSLDIYAGIWRRFARYARNAGGVTTVAGVSREGIATRFMVAPLVGGAGPSSRTVELRGTALRFLFRILRDVGLSDHDPLLDVVSPQREPRAVRPLTTREVELCRSAAPGTLVATREPAAWALMETGASTAEIGNVRHGHLNLDAALVRVGLDTLVDRTIPLSPWAVTHLRRLDGASWEWVLVGSSSSTGNGRRTRATELVRIVMIRAGVWRAREVTARSVTAWAGRRVLEETGSIEAAARRLGYGSLDATAALVGHRWNEH